MSGVTREQLRDRARELLPSIAGRAEKAGGMRRLPEESFQAFRESGLLRTFVPPEFGGYGLPLASVIEISSETAAVCGSSGWCLAICNLHNLMLNAFPAAAQQEVFGSFPDPVVCGVFMPGGQAVPVEGGHRLSGSWDFASACDHANHAILAALVVPEAGAPPVGMASFLVRREDFAIEDNWFVAGMEGTGSKRVIVEDLFVPEDWVMSLALRPAEDGRGSPATMRGLPSLSVATLGLAGVPLGIARGALHAFRDRLASKLRAASFRKADEQVAAQHRLAESAAELDGAELMVLRDCEEMERTAEAGRVATPEERGRYRRDAAFAFQTGARAVARLLPAAGAHAIFRESSLQRAMRDTQVMATHMVADWDMGRESYARALLDLPVDDPAF